MKSFLPHEFHVLDTLGQICDIVPLTLHQLPDPVLPLLQGTGHHLILPLLLTLLLCCTSRRGDFWQTIQLFGILEKKYDLCTFVCVGKNIGNTVQYNNTVTAKRLKMNNEKLNNCTKNRFHNFHNLILI